MAASGRGDVPFAPKEGKSYWTAVLLPGLGFTWRVQVLITQLSSMLFGDTMVPNTE